MPLEGKTLLLREERAEDQPLLVALRNDLETQAWTMPLPPDYTLPMYMRRFEAREFSYRRDDARFIIESRKSGAAAGYITYTALEQRWEATIGIMVARPFWGSGTAQEACEVLLEFLFQQLGLRVVRLWTHSGNQRAVTLAAKLGFQVSVRMRRAGYKDGQMIDNLMMDLLRVEYYARRSDLVDALPPLG